MNNRKTNLFHLFISLLLVSGWSAAQHDTKDTRTVTVVNKSANTLNVVVAVQAGETIPGCTSSTCTFPIASGGKKAFNFSVPLYGLNIRNSFGGCNLTQAELTLYDPNNKHLDSINISLVNVSSLDVLKTLKYYVTISADNGAINPSSIDTNEKISQIEFSSTDIHQILDSYGIFTCTNCTNNTGTPCPGGLPCKTKSTCLWMRPNNGTNYTVTFTDIGKSKK